MRSEVQELFCTAAFEQSHIVIPAPASPIRIQDVRSELAPAKFWLPKNVSHDKLSFAMYLFYK